MVFSSASISSLLSPFRFRAPLQQLDAFHGRVTELHEKAEKSTQRYRTHWDSIVQKCSKTKVERTRLDEALEFVNFPLATAMSESWYHELSSLTQDARKKQIFALSYTSFWENRDEPMAGLPKSLGGIYLIDTVKIVKMLRSVCVGCRVRKKTLSGQSVVFIESNGVELGHLEVQQLIERAIGGALSFREALCTEVLECLTKVKARENLLKRIVEANPEKEIRVHPYAQGLRLGVNANVVQFEDPMIATLEQPEFEGIFSSLNLEVFGNADHKLSASLRSPKYIKANPSCARIDRNDYSIVFGHVNNDGRFTAIDRAALLRFDSRYHLERLARLHDDTNHYEAMSTCVRVFTPTSGEAIVVGSGVTNLLLDSRFLRTLAAHLNIHAKHLRVECSFENGLILRWGQVSEAGFTRGDLDAMFSFTGTHRGDPMRHHCVVSTPINTRFDRESFEILNIEDEDLCAWKRSEEARGFDRFATYPTRASLLLHYGFCDDAYHEATRGLRCTSNDEDLLQTLAEAAIGMGECEDAIKVLEAKRSESLENFGSLFAILGVLYARTSRNQDAVDVLSAAIAYDENDVASMINLARVYIDSGKYNHADLELRRAATVAPDNADIYATLALLHDRRGESEEAQRAARKAIHFNHSLARIEVLKRLAA